MILDPFANLQPTSKPKSHPSPGRKPRRPSRDQLRLHMIQETELALFVGMHSPRNSIRIPTVQAGKGAFDADFAVRFWRGALGLGVEARHGKIWNQLQRLASSFRP